MTDLTVDDRSGVVAHLYMAGEDSPFTIPVAAQDLMAFMAESVDYDEALWIRLPTIHWDTDGGQPRGVATSWFRFAAVTSVHDRVVARSELEDLVMVIGEARRAHPDWFAGFGTERPA